jgi:hypothetical protein
MNSRNHTLPVTCWICGKITSLEACKIDEYGLPVHESCQTQRLAPHKERLPERGDSIYRRWRRTKAC